MSIKEETIENRFRKCYIAAVFGYDPLLRRFSGRLARDNVVLVDDIISHTENEFFDKYRPAENTKAALIAGLNKMGLQFSE